MVKKDFQESWIRTESIALSDLEQMLKMIVI